MTFKYGLDESPPLVEMVLLGLQWLAIAIPTILIIGKVVAGLHFNDSANQIIYIQKLFFVVAVSLLLQVLWGHRLPLVTGPATVLLVGIVASQASTSVIYTSILIGGTVLAIFSATGLFGRLVKFFTPRVIATILILIAFTLTPMIMNLIIAPAAQTAPANISFTLVFVFCMFLAARYLSGIWKATLIMWAIIAGSVVYFLLFPQSAGAIPVLNAGPAGLFFKNLNIHLALEPGVLISFLVCFLALAVNDLGSIQAVSELINPDRLQQRTTRGLAFTGILNVLSGFLGVIGPVNFSLSPGVIASTGVASRFTLIPAGIGLLILSFLPAAVAFISSIPSVVVGAVLIYIMCSQIAAGLLVAFNSMRGFKFESGLIMGLPLMLSIIISFLPAAVVNAFPAVVRPVIGNGFVVGVLAVLIMEHAIFRN